MAWHDDSFFFVVFCVTLCSTQKVAEQKTNRFPVEQAYRKTALAKSKFIYIIVYDNTDIPI